MGLTGGSHAAAIDAMRLPPTAFPKGKPIQKNLDTHYVNLEALFRSLAHEAFNGTVLMVFEEGTETLIVFREGTIITTYTHAKTRRTGFQALYDAMTLAKSSRAYVDVFKLEPELLGPVLALIHGAAVQDDAHVESPDQMISHLRKKEAVGAVVAGESLPEAVGLVYAGEPMGWYDAQGAESETGAAAPALKSSTLRAWTLEGADTYAAINLGADKVQCGGKMRDILFRELKELGFVLYDRALLRREIAEESKASKGQFLGLVEDLERDLTALRGAVCARRVARDMREVVDTMIDVGF